MQQDDGVTPARPEHPLIPAERVNGAAVFSLSGEKLGRIEDVAIEKVSGQVAYALLSFGGFLGVGEHYHPVPWRLLRYDVERRGYVIPCEKAQLEAAPSFRADDLSGWSDEHSRIAIFEYYAPFGSLP